MMHTRRQFLTQLGGGLGAVAMAQLLVREGWATGMHHPPKAKRVIQLFMNGGASPMDTFDYKPELARLHGQMLGPKEKPEGQTGERSEERRVGKECRSGRTRGL